MKIRGFEEISVNKQKNQNYKDGEIVMLPLRGTKTSAGYDFYTPVTIEIKPQDKVLIWTDVKAYMKDGEVLLIDVRSSHGINNDLMIANTLGVIDSDYYGNIKNDGNIGICLRNLKPAMELVGYENTYLSNDEGDTVEVIIPLIKDLTYENTVVIEAGDRVAQGFFVNYLESDNCNSEVERTGGTGSTNE